MKIILATYNYYPYAWGGSEVYVHGLAKFLQQQGQEVLVIAAIDLVRQPPANPLFTYQDEHLQVCEYVYEGVNVLGAMLTNETTEEVYSRYNTSHVSSWQLIMQKHHFFTFSVAAFHYNGYTTLISTAFVEALQTEQKRKNFEPTRVLASYHTPISCPNGKLLHFKKQACRVKPSPQLCTACFLNDKKNVPNSLASAAGLLLPALKHKKLHIALRVKHLIKSSLQSFQQLDNQVHQWLVMSDYIREVIVLAGVNPNKVALLRHGIHADFLGFQRPQTILEIQEQPTIFVYVGRFELIKGFHTLLQTWQSLPIVPEKRQLHIIGNMQSDIPLIEALLIKVKERPDVLFLGKKDSKEIRTILQGAACMIIPSEWVEIGPLVLHEAIACGANVLVSAIGGTAELAQFYGKGCQTFEMGNQEDLRTKIINFHYQSIAHHVQSQTKHYEHVLALYHLN